MKLRSSNIAYFLLLGSVIFPYGAIPFTDRIRDYFLIKVIILIIALFFLRTIPKKLTLILSLPFVTILWGDYVFETAMVNGALWLVYVLNFIVGYNLYAYKANFFASLLILLIEPIFATLIVGSVSTSINGAYLIGYVITIVYLFTNVFNSFSMRFVYHLFALYTSIGRFILLTSFLLFQRPRLVFISGLMVAFILTYITYSTKNLLIYQFLLGYRVFEYVVVFSNGYLDLLFGQGLGTSLKSVELGTKGLVVHGGRFHNFYLTITYNYGIIYLLIFLQVLTRGIWLKNVSVAKRLALAAWCLVVIFDGPRDGYWPLFLTLGVCFGESKNLNRNSSLLSTRL